MQSGFTNVQTSLSVKKASYVEIITSFSGSVVFSTLQRRTLDNGSANIGACKFFAKVKILCASSTSTCGPAKISMRLNFSSSGLALRILQSSLPVPLDKDYVPLQNVWSLVQVPKVQKEVH